MAEKHTHIRNALRLDVNGSGGCRGTVRAGADIAQLSLGHMPETSSCSACYSPL